MKIVKHVSQVVQTRSQLQRVDQGLTAPVCGLYLHPQFDVYQYREQSHVARTPGNLETPVKKFTKNDGKSPYQ